MVKKYLQENEIRSIVRDEMSKILSPIVTPNPPQKYLPTSKAWKELGFQTKQDLYDAVDKGLFRIGIEVVDRRKPGSTRAIYSFNIPTCQARLAQPPEKRVMSNK
jgi:hypothetical protein